MHPKRALKLTLLLGFSLWALTALLPDREVLAANKKPGPAIEQAGGSSPGAIIVSSRVNTGGTLLTGDPDQTTQSGDTQPSPAGVPGGRSLLERLLRTLGSWVAPIRETTVR
ncbi:MAG TPA: hypothetical protein VF720_09685 [Candidatus Eisenbacteria bacterium]